ncbi:MAG TPA: Rieske 2Fe-2S domain-containing protein [Nostocaceae cyanobacterium]|nr:Rieske 2Fe-2S domain-containing protein [Nostocaceae cyanobacterium]
MNSKLENPVASKPTQSKTETKADPNYNKFAASWYIVMQSKALSKEPKAIELFGQSLVAWRDQNNQPVIMERFCPHMGGDLAIGEVVEGSIQCPFHHWSFNSFGECTSIPNVDYIPDKACQITYITAEKYGYVWLWYGSKTPLFSLPESSSLEDYSHNYMPFRSQSSVKSTVRRVGESPYDYSHIVTVHDQKISAPIKLTLTNYESEKQNQLVIPPEAGFGALVEFPNDNSYMGRLDTLAKILGLHAESFTLKVDSWPGGAIITAFIDGVEKFKVLNAPTPVAQEQVIVHVLLMVKKTGNFLLDILYYLLFVWQNNVAITEDNQIFNSMKLDGGGVYIKDDLGVLKFREFYKLWVSKVEQ